MCSVALFHIFILKILLFLILFNQFHWNFNGIVWFYGPAARLIFIVYPFYCRLDYCRYMIFTITSFSLFNQTRESYFFYYWLFIGHFTLIFQIFAFNILGDNIFRRRHLILDLVFFLIWNRIIALSSLLLFRFSFDIFE